MNNKYTYERILEILHFSQDEWELKSQETREKMLDEFIWNINEITLKGLYQALTLKK